MSIYIQGHVARVSQSQHREGRRRSCLHHHTPFLLLLASCSWDLVLFSFTNLISKTASETFSPTQTTTAKSLSSSSQTRWKKKPGSYGPCAAHPSGPPSEKLQGSTNTWFAVVLHPKKKTQRKAIILGRIFKKRPWEQRAAVFVTALFYC